MGLGIAGRFKAALEGADLEQRKIIEYLPAASGAKILDIGCGYGRNLRALIAAGLDAVGVETNPQIVQKNREQGLPCYLPGAPELKEKSFDAILISHVIEHFSPSDLKTFLELQLRLLKKGGRLVIATPLMSPYFFDDFDHIRPYHADSLLLLMGSGQSSQMQYHSSFNIRLLDIWFRPSPFRRSHARGRYMPGSGRLVFTLLNLALLIVHRLSMRLIGRNDGWVGVFELN